MRIPALALTTLALLGAALWWWATPAPPIATTTATTAPRAIAPIGPIAPAAAEDHPTTEAHAAAFAAEVDAVGAACDLPLHTTCDGDRCVAVTAVPSLDTPLGWLALGRTSPRLVAAVVAGDLGLPDASTACRAAIRGLSASAILARPATGGEVWCAVDPADDDDPDVLALCDRAVPAAPIGRFADAGPARRVILRPPLRE